MTNSIVYRALVTYSNATTGEIRVKIPSLIGVNSEVSISYIGRTAHNSSWTVPDAGSQIIVSADDANLTNIFWIQTDIIPSTGGGATTLDELTDVTITSPIKYQTLEYDGTGWVNAEASVATYVRNAESTTLNVGEVVYLYQQQGDRASVKRAYNSGDATSAKTLGVVATTIAPSSDGVVVTQGYVYGCNLGSYTAGQTVYLGATAGTITATKPHAPNHLVYVGVVVRANNGNGIIYVRAQNGYELDEIHDVDLYTTPPTTGNVLTYNGSLWVAATPSGPAGAAATISVGTTTTGAAGSSATVTNSGTSSAAVFDFSIPKGDTGATGSQGPQGIQGVKGDTGDTGATGAAATVAVGTTTTGSAGSSASVTNSGTSSAAVFDFTIPRGAIGLGYAGVVSISSVTIGTGSKVFTMNSSTNAFVTGSRVRAANATTPTNYVEGIATVSGTTITIAADRFGGSGTFADWTFSIAGNVGNDGTDGTSIEWWNTWSSSIIYSVGFVVYYNGSSYISTVNGNTNNIPSSSPTQWELVAQKGDTGATGSAATVAVGTTTTGAAGSSASVTNSGTSSAAVLNFTVPQGATGATGATGAAGGWNSTQTIVSGATYTPSSADVGKMIQLTNTSAINITVNTGLGLTAGQSIDFMRYGVPGTGAGTVTFNGTATIYGTPALTLRAQYSSASLFCVSTNTYVLIGDLG